MSKKWKHGTDCALCMWNVMRGMNWPGHVGYRSPQRLRKERARVAMKKPVVAVDPSGGILPKSGPSVLESVYPVLWEFLTDSQWDDGTKRELPTLLFFIEAGQWKCCLSDKALERVTFVAGYTPDDCLESLATRLETDSVEWRAKKPFVPSRKKS